MFTRQQYMNKECTHQEYYEQFCSLRFVNIVVNYIGAERIQNSTDPYFNDIPLQKWDRFAPIARNVVGRAMAEFNASTHKDNAPALSQADFVCVSKAAAGIYKRQYEAGEFPVAQKKFFHGVRVLKDVGKVVIAVEIRWDDRCGNGHNTFGITGQLRRYNEKEIEECGCIHNRIVECFPELAKYVKWHGMTSSGPLYYTQNTLYHADQHGPTRAWVFEHKREIAGVQIAEQCLIYTDLAKAQEMVEAEPSLFLKVDDKTAKTANLESARSSAIAPEATLEQLRDKQWLEARLPALMEEFKADLKELGFTF